MFNTKKPKKQLPIIKGMRNEMMVAFESGHRGMFGFGKKSNLFSFFACINTDMVLYWSRGHTVIPHFEVKRMGTESTTGLGKHGLLHMLRGSVFSRQASCILNGPAIINPLCLCRDYCFLMESVVSPKRICTKLKLINYLFNYTLEVCYAGFIQLS